MRVANCVLTSLHKLPDGRVRKSKVQLRQNEVRQTCLPLHSLDECACLPLHDLTCPYMSLYVLICPYCYMSLCVLICPCIPLMNARHCPCIHVQSASVACWGQFGEYRKYHKVAKRREICIYTPYGLVGGNTFTVRGPQNWGPLKT